MDIVRNVDRIRRYGRLAQVLGIVSLVALGAAFILGFQGSLGLQLLGLGAGFILSQVSIYLANEYIRQPRQDEVLDDALRKVVDEGRLYHWVLPVAHVLLTPAGPIIFHTKYQTGHITVEKNDRGEDKWKQKGVGIIRRFFGQENLGKPTREAEIMVEKLANFIRKNAPEVEEVPIGIIIVFTARRPKESAWDLDLDAASLPAMHYTKVRGYLRQQGLGESIPEKDYERLREAFDAKAEDQDLLDEEGVPYYE